MTTTQAKETVAAALKRGWIKFPPQPTTRSEILIDAQADVARRAGVKPRRERTPEEHRAYQAAIQRRLRAERRGEDVSKFPGRVRGRRQ